MTDFITYAQQDCLIEADGRTHSYAAVGALAQHYADGLGEGRGLLLLGCRSDMGTIVAYLGARAANCPVMFVDDMRDDMIEELTKVFRPLYVQRAGETAPIVHEDGVRDIHPDLAILLSTSGSTGAAKAVRLSAANVEANARSIAEYLDLRDTDRAALTLPLHYSYGLSVLNSHLACGASIWLADQSVSEAAFWETFKALGCTNFPGVPHSYQILQRNRFDTRDIPSLRHATQAGGHLDADSVRHFADMAERDGWNFYVMYGQTEAAPRMAYVPPAQLKDNPGSIGVAVPGGTFRLECEPGEESGELVYTGPNVMMGYALEAADLSRGKEVDALHTGDIAVRNANGMFNIVGRMSRFIKPFGLRVSLDEVERWLAGHDVIAAAVGDDNRLAIYSEQLLPDEIVGELARWLKLPLSCVAPHHVWTMPRQASGKIDYAVLKRLFQSDDIAAPARSEVHGGIEELFAAHFPGVAITDGDSFVSLGGDSLKYVQFSMELEDMLGTLPDQWEQLTVTDIATLYTRRGVAIPATGRSWLRPLDTGTFFRAFGIFAVISHHLGFLGTPNGSLLLLALAGISFGRFQVADVLRTGKISAITGSVVRIGIPTLGWVALNQLLHRQLFLPGLLLVSNYLPPHTGFDEWYLDVYVQLFLAAALLLSFRPVRDLMRREPVSTSLVVFGLSIVSFMVMPKIWNTTDLDNRVPHMMLWLFAWGNVMAQMRSRNLRIVGVVLFCATMLTFVPQTDNRILLSMAAVVVTFVPSIPFPVFLRRPIAEVASASLFIYLTHFQVTAVVAAAIGMKIPLVSVAMSLAVGVAFAHGYQWIEKHAPALLAATKAQARGLLSRTDLALR